MNIIVVRALQSHVSHGNTSYNPTRPGSEKIQG